MLKMSGDRVSVRLKCPNPLFEKWLSEWQNEAIAKNSKSQYVYTNALKSLKKYPLPLATGRECKILKGFGDKLCKMLDKKLEEEFGVNSKSKQLKTSTSSNLEEFTLKPHTFDIVLCVDNNETSGSAKSHQDEILTELAKSRVKFEVKSLKIGDFTWICRDRLTATELILPYVIERKRMDDFASSIKDRRYQEQKFRLKKSGVENLTYLIESHGTNVNLGLPLSSLRQATTNTAVQDNFYIKFTENTSETARYLAELTRTLVQLFQSKILVSCQKDKLPVMDINEDRIALMTFRDFNQASVKNKRPKITDLFVKCLIQIKGMSVERALAIVRHYPTPTDLKKAFEACPELDSREKMLARVQYGPGTAKTIGPVLSRSIAQCFCNLSY